MMKHTKRVLSILLVMLMAVTLSLSATALPAFDNLGDLINTVKDADVTVTVYDNATINADALTAMNAKLGTHTNIIDAVPSGNASAVKREIFTYRGLRNTTADVRFSSFALAVDSVAPTDVVAMTVSWKLPGEGSVGHPSGRFTTDEAKTILNDYDLTIVWDSEAGPPQALTRAKNENIGDVKPLFTLRPLLQAEVIKVFKDDSGDECLSINVATYDGTGAPSIAGDFLLLPDGDQNGRIYDPLWLVTGLKWQSIDGEWVTIHPADTKQNPHTGR